MLLIFNFFWIVILFFVSLAFRPTNTQEGSVAAGGDPLARDGCRNFRQALPELRAMQKRCTFAEPFANCRVARRALTSGLS